MVIARANAGSPSSEPAQPRKLNAATGSGKGLLVVVSIAGLLAVTWVEMLSALRLEGDGVPVNASVVLTCDRPCVGIEEEDEKCDEDVVASKIV